MNAKELATLVHYLNRFETEHPQPRCTSLFADLRTRIRAVATLEACAPATTPGLLHEQRARTWAPQRGWVEPDLSVYDEAADR